MKNREYVRINENQKRNSIRRCLLHCLVIKAENVALKMCFRGDSPPDVIQHCAPSLKFGFHPDFLSSSLVSRDKFTVLSFGLNIIEPIDFEARAHEHRGDQNLIAGALELAEVFKSLDEPIW